MNNYKQTGIPGYSNSELNTKSAQDPSHMVPANLSAPSPTIPLAFSFDILPSLYTYFMHTLLSISKVLPSP